MDVVLSNMGRAFLKAFGASLLVVLIGLSSQPDLHASVGVGVAGLIASVAAGLTALTTYIPALSVETYIGKPHGAIIDSFIRAFLSAFVTAAAGWLAEPNLSTWHAAVVGIMVGALTAGLRAVQGALTKGEGPFLNTGVAPPVVSS